MQKLKSEELIHLTSRVIKVLAQNRITTILEFLQEDAEKLSTLTKLSLPQIIAVRDDIFKKYSAPLVSGASLLVKSSMKSKILSTGIQSLDAITGGGLPIGHTTELCGLADSGKTQLCFQLSINCVKNTDNTALYIDTKGDFSATRIQSILSSCKYSHKEMAAILFKIKVAQIWNMEELIELFKKLKNKSITLRNLSLIIIDSLACLMFQHLGDDNKVGLSFLNTLVNYSRFLSKELNLSIVCVNIQTRWVDQVTDTDVEDDGDQTLTSKEPYIEKRNRCLGRYWQHIPALVLFMTKVKHKNVTKTDYSSQINVTVRNNNNQKCLLKVSCLGVT